MGTFCLNLNAEVDEVHAEQGKLVGFARSASKFVVPEHRASFSSLLSLILIGEFACLDQLSFYSEGQECAALLRRDFEPRVAWENRK
jgi:hypothetical protein